MLRHTVRQVMHGLKKVQLRPGVEGRPGTVPTFVEHQMENALLLSDPATDALDIDGANVPPDGQRRAARP